jgi:hypothetical protein
MKRILPVVLAMAAGLVAASAQAQQADPKLFAQGTRVVVVGPITSQPRDAGIAVESKMQVGIGPERRDYTLHLKDAQLLGFHGNKIEKSGLKDKMWIRAEGQVMDDPRRIKVSRLQVVGADLPGLRRSAFYRTGFDHGYVMAVAGARETYPDTAGRRFEVSPFTIVGRVSDDTGTFERSRKIQVDSAGNTWTLNVARDAPVIDSKGEKISVHEIKKGQWVRASGWQTDDLRMRVLRVEYIGPEEAFRTSTFYRPDFPLGYMDRISGQDTHGRRVSVQGTITYVDLPGGYFTVKDANGKEHAIYAELAEIRRNNQAALFETLRSGDVVTVNVHHIQF